MTLGLALLGTGRIAENAFAPAVKGAADADLVAVLSRDAARAAEFAQQHGIAKSYDDLDALLRDPDVEGVIVATRTRRMRRRSSPRRRRASISCAKNP